MAEKVVSTQSDDKDTKFLKEKPEQLEVYKLSGPGVRFSTANHQTYVQLDIVDTPGSSPCTVTAELKAVVSGKLPGWLKKKPRTDVVISKQSPTQYIIRYGTASRGKYKLHIRINESEIQGSPFDVITYPDPSHLHPQMKEIPSLGFIEGLAANAHRELLVSLFSGNRVVVINNKGEEIRSFGNQGYGPNQRLTSPSCIGIDDDTDCVYISSHNNNKVIKFSGSGEPLASVGKVGNGDGEFAYPGGIAIHKQEVYICDKGNNRIQVFDTDLKYKRRLRFHKPHSQPPQLKLPSDINIDDYGIGYIADSGNNRILVVDVLSGEFIREIGHEEGEGKLFNPTELCLAAEFLYISDDDNCRNVIYNTNGELVATLQRHMVGGTPFKGPCKFTADRNGHIYSLGALGKYTKY